MRKWLPVLPIALALGLTVWFYSDLPLVVQPQWKRVMPFDAQDEGMSRAGFAALLPLVALVVWGRMLALARIRGARGIPPSRLGAAAIERFEPTFHIVVLGVVTLVALLHISFLAAALGWPEWTLQAIGATYGLGLALIGNLMPRVRPNWIVGIRTRATLNDPELWLRTHRYFGGLLMLAGVVVILIAPIAPRYALAAFGAGFLAAAVLAHGLAKR